MTVGGHPHDPGLVETTLWKSTERRPVGFGGAETASEAGAAALALGLAANDVGARVIRDVEAERFYILTHPHAVEYAEERWTEIDKAFRAQAPRQTGDDQYRVDNVLKRLGMGG